MEIALETGSAEILELRKGRGFVYAHGNQLYNSVKKVGNIKYLKCCRIGCDGSAMIVDGKISIGVRKYIHSNVYLNKCYD